MSPNQPQLFPEWVKCKPLRKRSFIAKVRRVHPDGSVDVTDPRGSARTFAPGMFEPAKRPKTVADR